MVLPSGPVLAFKVVDGWWRPHKYTRHLGPAARLEYAQDRIILFKNIHKELCQKRELVLFHQATNFRDLDDKDKMLCQNYEAATTYCHSCIKMWNNYIACRKGDKEKHWPWPHEGRDRDINKPYSLAYYNAKHFFPNKNCFLFE